MVKEPRPGRVKTRLGKGIGLVPAAWWFRHQTRRLLRRLEDPRWTLILAVAPDAEGRASRVWPAHLPRIAQGSGDLGARMGRIFRGLPPGRVCVIGADIPGITPAHVAEAFRQLGPYDAVFGPSEDGGYWLIGLKRMAAVPPGLFEDVRWSSEYALADTKRSLGQMAIAEVATLRDVDEARDL
jgi:rSAM/selenodomain-associated transferase 1